MNREDHMAWCKQRALEYVERGDLQNAYASMTGDLNKHEETRNHPAIALGLQLMMIGDLGTSDKMRKFIEGFN